MWITRVSIKNPVFATMVMVGIVVLGLFSYARLRVEQMPDVTLPFVDIETIYPGASPEVVESDVTKPIENAVNTVSGVKRIYSNSREAQSQVFVEFRQGTDVTRAIQEARDKIALVRTAVPPRRQGSAGRSGSRSRTTAPRCRLRFFPRRSSCASSRRSPTRPSSKALENIPGVAQVIVNGRVTRQILIQIKPTALNALGIGIDQVITAIQKANQDVPAGRITRGQNDAVVRVEGKIKDPAQFARIVVAQQMGVPMYLSQVADVIDGEKEQDSISRINGRPSITIDIRKGQDANIVEVGASVNAALEVVEIAPAAGRRSADSSTRRPIRSRRASTASRARYSKARFSRCLIVFLFLHSWRSTIITGLTLPIAVIATFIALYAFGFTLNMMTLMALSLCIGLLIDDAIVVRENIVRHLGMGKTHPAAAREGTDEIGLAVMATTFAIVAVFVPIAFMKGIIGQFFFQFGLTVAVAVLMSLFVSFTLDPMLSSVWHDPPGSRFRRAPWLGRFMDRVESVVVRLHEVYGRMLEWAIGHRGVVLLLAALIFVASFGILPFIEKEFQPQVDESFISLRLNTPWARASSTPTARCARSKRR